METRHYWEENGHAVKYDNYNSNDGFGRAAGEQLNFAAPSEDEADYPPGAYLKKGKVSRQDPMSHRIIEKRRRDRMNNCLADLSRLIPPEYLKKGRGRVEKTEIIEMAIRHLKFLQDRANGLYTGHGASGNVRYNWKIEAVERHASKDFRAGYQEAVAEVIRFLVEVHGYGTGEGLCGQLASHLQRHCDAVTKGEPFIRVKHSSHPGSLSETNSSSHSSSSSHGYAIKGGVITSAPPPAPPPFTEPYDERQQENNYHMDCGTDLSLGQSAMATDSDALLESEPLPLDGRRKREMTLRAVRKPEHTEDYLHSYKFKNSIERRFSRSQDTEAAEMQSAHAAGSGGGEGGAGRVITRARRRGKAPQPVSTSNSASASNSSASTCNSMSNSACNSSSNSTSNSACNSSSGSGSASASGSTEDARDNSPQDTSSQSPHNHHYEKPPPPTQYVPVFALNALGKYYVPLSVDYACLARHLGPYDALDARLTQLSAPMHPVTIHVNFQPCLNYHVKREPTEREWRTA